MVDLKQQVETRWNNTTKSWYEDKGYVFTKPNDVFYVKVEDLKPSSNVLVDVICDYCNKEYSLPYTKYNKSTKNGKQRYACMYCASRKAKELHFSETQIDQYNKFCSICAEKGVEPVSTINDYQNAHSELKYICPKHGLKKSKYIDFITAKHPCSDCAKEAAANVLSLSPDRVKEIVESKNNNVLLNPNDYKNAVTKNLRVVCGSCGKEFITSLSSITNGDGRCINCAHKYVEQLRLLSPDEVERRINSVNDNVLLNKNEYVGNSCCNLRIRCSCGKEFVTSLVGYEYFHVDRCYSCNKYISKGEKNIKDILDKYDIPFIMQCKFENCIDKRHLPFDFYLTEEDLCIEFDGPQHFMPVFGIDEYKKTIRHDKIKNNYCNNNSIDLLRIPYWEASNSEEIICSYIGINNK